MFNPRAHEHHEWTLADFTADIGELGIDERIAAIADHQCTPAFAKQVVSAFGLINTDFYLQREQRLRYLVQNARSLNINDVPDPHGAMRSGERCIARSAWHLEQAWLACDQLGEAGLDDIEDLEQATCALMLPLENIEASVRSAAARTFPFEWIACYVPRKHAFHQFDAAKLNANSLQYRGSATAIAALFRFATMGADDFCTVCAALLMDHGADASLMEPLRQALLPKRERDPWLFTYQALPSLVEDRAWGHDHDAGASSRAQAVRSCLIQPLAALYECGAILAEETPSGHPSVLDRRLRAALANAA